MKINPILAIDSYKLAHIAMYPEEIKETYLNLTPRAMKYFQRLIPSEFKYDNKIVAFGVQMTVIDLVTQFSEEFFSKPLNQVLDIYIDTITPFIGDGLGVKDHVIKEITKLHQLGYLPITIKALPEGSLIPVQTPVLTIKSTQFAWLGGYLETYISQNTWKTITTATVARLYRKILEHFSDITCDNNDHLTWQGHNFADRGMSGTEDATRCGIAHATQFQGSDSVHAAYAAKHIYGFKTPLFAASVPATEHSIMQLGISQSSEKETIQCLIKQYHSGILSVVCDTEDYWNTLTNILPSVKEEILARTPNSLGLAKFVVRPDSGDPVDVICGTKLFDEIHNEYDMYDYIVELVDEEKEAICKYNGVFYSIDGAYIQQELIEEYGRDHIEFNIETLTSDGYGGAATIIEDPRKDKPEEKGSIEILWDIFGGTINSKGYKVLNPKVGLIYGDSITPQRAYEICKRLQAKGFASSNVVFGIGSYAYNYHTRDTLGMAIKCTAAWDIKHNLIETQKTVKTDSVKKSAKGLLHVDSNFVTTDSVTPEQEATGELKVIYSNGTLLLEHDFELIRTRAQQ